jgi:hypothetical protein
MLASVNEKKFALSVSAHLLGHNEQSISMARKAAKSSPRPYVNENFPHSVTFLNEAEIEALYWTDSPAPKTRSGLNKVFKVATAPKDPLRR